MLDTLPIQADPNVLVGHAGSDDAGVYRLTDDTAVVLTVDFFTPIVDDPYDFGRVAAANSLSDVYAMGGRPFAALNIAGFPEDKIPPDALADILKGGAEVARQAGVAVVGGHTINDGELKYGLAVAGLVHPERIVTNAGAKAGNKLVLTKPIGTGVLSTALKSRMLDEDGVRRLVDEMTTLNRHASEKMLEFGVTACTDITGFGLAGHAFEMARASRITIEIDSVRVSLIEGALEASRKGFLPGGGNKNRRYVEDAVTVDPAIDAALQNLLFDPQTAGGLLIAVPAENSAELLSSLLETYPSASEVGACVPAVKNVSVAFL